jgi:hypothetical protein
MALNITTGNEYQYVRRDYVINTEKDFILYAW